VLKEIKTKSTIKDIKVLDKATDVSRRAKNAYIRTKEQAERLGHNEDANYVGDAANSVLDGAETVVRKAGHTAGNYSKKAVEKIQERRAPDADTPRYHDSNRENVRQPPTNEVKETVHRDVPRTEAKPATEQGITSVKAKEAARHNVSQPGAKQVAKHNVIQSRVKETATKRKFTLSKPGELAKRRFVQSRAKKRFSQISKIRTANQANQNIAQIQSQQISERIPAQRPLFQPAKKAATQTLHPSGKTGLTIKQSADTGVISIKEAAKGTVKTAQRSIKTAGHTAKATVKTSQVAAKTAAKTAQDAQRAAQAARTAARAAAVSAKTAVKAMLATIKAIIAAAKSLITLIAAGGWVAVVVILVICLAGLLLGSVFGVFYSNESFGGNTPVMTEVVSWLNEEFTAEIERIKDENPHDTLELSSNGSSTVVINWREILAVYAVKAAADPENGMEIATLDDAKVGILRDVFWDMNKIDYWLETIEHEETVTTILHINVTSKSYADMIAEYGFNAQQVIMLNELMKDEYQQLFIRLIGSSADITLSPWEIAAHGGKRSEKKQNSLKTKLYER